MREKTAEGDVLESLYNLFEGSKRFFNASESKIFPIKIEGTVFSDIVSDHSNLKILTPKQMFQRLLIALAQVNTVNTSVHLPNEIRKIICSLY